MDELTSFINNIKKYSTTSNFSTENARQIIIEINNFLFAYKDKQFINNKSDEIYFSEFHKYWLKNHENILGKEILNEEKCEEVAEALHKVYIITKGEAFKQVWNTYGLSVEDVCNIRFLTANQDFNGSRNFKDFVDIFNKDKSVFEIGNIQKDPAAYVKNINLGKLSQTDKRIKYAKNVCDFLIEHNTTPYNMIKDVFNNDVYEFRQTLTSYLGAGYGNKKTDMFIRDMVVLGIWKDVKNFDKIDVASDINTIKVALRTGILEPKIPLLSSFMDIFDYQYSYIEKKNAEAWRMVWEKWKEKYPNDVLPSPCLIDYFIYNVVGKQICKENLCIFKCEHCNQEFICNRLNKKCGKCNGNLVLVKRVLPCSNKEGCEALNGIEFCNTYHIKSCPFEKICCEKNKNLQPPKAISIKGMTGWESGYSKIGTGGGGLRS